MSTYQPFLFSSIYAVKMFLEMMVVLDSFIMVQLAICMFLGLIDLVTNHLFTCLKPDPIVLQSQKLHIYMMVSDSDSNFKIHRIKNLIMLTYQF